MNPRQPPSPSLTPSFPLASKETGRVITNVVSPEPHRGWHSRGYLPHWDHPGMIQSLNFRLGDAMPQEVLDRWKNELGLTNPAGSASVSPAASPKSRRDAGAPRQNASAPGEQQRQIELRRRAEEYLDAGHGACWLRQPEVAALVEGALRHFDGERYRLLAWCVMPNHVHVLIETRDGFPWPMCCTRGNPSRAGRQANWSDAADSSGSASIWTATCATQSITRRWPPTSKRTL